MLLGVTATYFKSISNVCYEKWFLLSSLLSSGKKCRIILKNCYCLAASQGIVCLQQREVKPHGAALPYPWPYRTEAHLVLMPPALG